MNPRFSMTPEGLFRPDFTRPYRLAPVFKERVWGGTALLPEDPARPIGEAWLIHEDQEIHPGLNLNKAAYLYPEALLGPGQGPQRFPLLIKLLDCQDWLSVQVHPDDHQAQRLLSPDANGKTEAWHVLQAEPEAKIISGVDPELPMDTLRDLILTRRISEAIRTRSVEQGATFFVPAGTIHALGPGLLIYEVQQSSDVTYRVHDWDRPESTGRALHLSESAEVARPGEVQVILDDPGNAEAILTQCAYFTLSRLTVGDAPQYRSTFLTGLECLTVIDGTLELSTRNTHLTLRPFETVLLPAALGAYTLAGSGCLLRAHLPMAE